MYKVRWVPAGRLRAFLVATLVLCACETGAVSQSRDVGRSSYRGDSDLDAIAGANDAGSQGPVEREPVPQPSGGNGNAPPPSSGNGSDPEPASDRDGGAQDGGTGSPDCMPTGTVELCGNGLDDDCDNGADDGCVAAQGAFQFVNGCAVFEVEAVLGSMPPGDWEYRTKQPPCAKAGTCSFSGDGHYVFQPGEGCGLIQASDAHLLKYAFEVKSAGTFRMAFRNLEDNATDSCEGDRNNDAFVAFPSTTSDPAFRKPFKVFHGGNGGAWDWNARYDIAGLSPDKEDVCVALSEGVHELELRGRAPNFYIDRIAICRYDDLKGCRDANSASYEQLPLSPRAP